MALLEGWRAAGIPTRTLFPVPNWNKVLVQGNPKPTMYGSQAALAGGLQGRPGLDDGGNWGNPQQFWTNLNMSGWPYGKTSAFLPGNPQLLLTPIPTKYGNLSPITVWGRTLLYAKSGAQYQSQVYGGAQRYGVASPSQQGR